MGAFVHPHPIWAPLPISQHMQPYTPAFGLVGSQWTGSLASAHGGMSFSRHPLPHTAEGSGLHCPHMTRTAGERSLQSSPGLKQRCRLRNARFQRSSPAHSNRKYRLLNRKLQWPAVLQAEPIEAPAVTASSCIDGEAMHAPETPHQGDLWDLSPLHDDASWQKGFAEHRMQATWEVMTDLDTDEAGSVHDGETDEEEHEEAPRLMQDLDFLINDIYHRNGLSGMYTKHGAIAPSYALPLERHNDPLQAEDSHASFGIAATLPALPHTSTQSSNASDAENALVQKQNEAAPVPEDNAWHIVLEQANLVTDVSPSVADASNAHEVQAKEESSEGAGRISPVQTVVEEEEEEDQEEDEENEEDNDEEEEEEWEKADFLDKLEERLAPRAVSANTSTGKQPEAQRALPVAKGVQNSTGSSDTGGKESQHTQIDARLQGVVKWFRGSFGWIACPDVAKMHGVCDVFLHKLQCNGIPKLGDNVSFLLTWDDKGNPKAAEAQIVEPPKLSAEPTRISARDYFTARKTSLLA